jgi:sarcosine oxidase subunit beta
MGDAADVVVVGGGVYGAAIAYHLALGGERPLLLERGSLASGPTGRSSANVRVHYLRHELSELTARSLAFLRDFEARTGGDCGLVETGFVFLLPEADEAAWRASAARLRARGMDVEACDPGDLGEVLPGFPMDGVAVALVEPRGGYADPVGTTTGLARAAVRHGATLRTGTGVRRVIAAGGWVQGVETEAGERIDADRVVLATGPWTGALAATAGVALPLHAERHPIAVLDARPSARAVLPVVLADLTRDVYARPEGSASIIVGSRDRYPPVADIDDWGAGVGPEESAALAARAAARIPDLDRLGVRRGWAGLYDCTPDRNPIVDAVAAVNGLFLACGTSGHGFKMAIAIGEQVARLVGGGSTELLEPFRLDRAFDPGGRDLGSIVRASTVRA